MQSLMSQMSSFVARRMSAMSSNLAKQFNHDLSVCELFSIQYDESVEQYGLADDVYYNGVQCFHRKKKCLTLLSLKTTTKAVDIHDAMKSY